MKQKIIFEYQADEGWDDVVSKIKVYADGTVYYGTEKTLRYNRDTFEWEFVYKAALSEELLEKVKNILRDRKLYHLWPMDHPGAYAYDGTSHFFYFASGHRRVKYKEWSISYGRHRYLKYPKTAYLVDVFKKIERILVKAGVDKECFYLG